jgi:hypothetical protein
MSQFELLIKTISFLNDEKIPYMLVGSFVSSIYGEPRTTQDVDLVIQLHMNPELFREKSRRIWGAKTTNGRTGNSLLFPDRKGLQQYF